MEKLPELLLERNAEKIARYLFEHDCEIVKNGVVYEIVPLPSRKDWVAGQVVFYDSRQMARKILLNSLYGALLNEALRFSDERMGQSVTLTGRSITKHMNAETNKTLTGEYDYDGESVVYADTDSLFRLDSITYSGGKLSVEDFFAHCAKTKTWSEETPYGTKEYAWADENVLSYDPNTDQAVLMPINYVYRHKVSKPKWRITDQFGNQVTVTGDHSVMVERGGILMEVKPKNILQDDIILSISDAK